MPIYRRLIDIDERQPVAHFGGRLITRQKVIPRNGFQPFAFMARWAATAATRLRFLLREIRYFRACIHDFLFRLMVVSEALRTVMMQDVVTRRKPMTTEEQLLERYGPLLSLTELSELLKRSPDGLRIALRSQTEFAQKWNAVKRKVGRRVYFRASDVAELIDEA